MCDLRVVRLKGLQAPVGKFMLSMVNRDLDRKMRTHARLCRLMIVSLAILAVRAAAGICLLFTRLRLHELLLLPLGLSFPLTLLVAAAKFGQEAGVISLRDGTSIILAAVLTALVYPWFFKLGARRLLSSAPGAER